MNDTLTLVVVALTLVIGGSGGIAIGWIIGTRRGRKFLSAEQDELLVSRRHLAEQESARIVSEGAANARQYEVRAQEAAIRAANEAEESIKRRRAEIDRETERQDRRREELDKRVERVDVRDRELIKRVTLLDKRQQILEKSEADKKAELERVAQMTREEARAELLAAIETEARADMSKRIRELDEEFKQDADRRARDVIALAIQRLASDQVSELTVSVVQLPSDEMKGRIIGRSGRNIRAFEMATGVDVVVDDTPEAVTISSFDPIRREIAKRALGKLVLDGRIQPGRIEKLVDDAKKEVDKVIREEGDNAAYQAGVPGLHPEILKLLGRLKFRTSYGQNQHAHSIETAHLAAMIAAELGADVQIARMGGLLHDIGKSIDHEVEGTHALIGAEFVKRYTNNERVINAIAAHHHEVEQLYVESIIVEAADAISGARPGARRESLETYIKRVKGLEDIANAFEGVEASYALQAGREVRVIVKPESIDDVAAMRLSRDIAKRIEETMEYPGMIKVQVIRETRSTEYAR